MTKAVPLDSKGVLNVQHRHLSDANASLRKALHPGETAYTALIQYHLEELAAIEKRLDVERKKA